METILYIFDIEEDGGQNINKCTYKNRIYVKSWSILEMRFWDICQSLEAPPSMNSIKLSMYASSYNK